MVQPEASEALSHSRGATGISITVENTNNTGLLSPCLPYVLLAITPHLFLEEENKGWRLASTVVRS